MTLLVVIAFFLTFLAGFGLGSWFTDQAIAEKKRP